MMKKRISAIILSAALSLTLLTGCSGSFAGTKETSSIANGSVVSTVQAPNGTLEWVKYDDPNGYFSMTVPKGWTVNTYDFGYDGNTFCGTKITVFNPDLHVGTSDLDFFTIKSELMPTPTVENYFRTVFNSSSDITEWNVKSTSVPDDLQQTTNAIKNASPSSFIYDSKCLRVEWTQSNFPGEGEYQCIVMNSGLSPTAYYISNVSTFYAPRGQYDQWSAILKQIDASIVFNENYLQYRKALSEKIKNGGNSANAANGNYITPGAAGIMNGDTGGGYNYDGLTSSYNARNQAEDIYNQKRQDALFGRERMQDNSTGDIYYTDPSFYEDYQNNDGQRYSPIEDSQYLDGTNGTICW